MKLSYKQLLLVAVASLFLGVVWDVLFFGKMPGISFVIYVGLLLAGFYFFADFLGLSFYKTTSRSLKLLALPIVFFSLMLAIRDSNFLSFWNVVAALGLLLIFAGSVVGRSLKDYRLFDFLKTAVELPLRYLAAGLGSLAQLISIGKRAKDRESTAQILKGLVVTLPIVFFFIILLSSADLVFGRLVSGLFSWQMDFSNFGHYFWVIFFAFIWLGTYSYLFQNSSPAPVPQVAKETGYRFGKIEAGILLGALNFLFAVFVFIQIKYLFAGQQAITGLGYTYADYAHKGFGELVAVAILSFALIFGSEKYIEKRPAGHYGFFKVLSGCLVGLLLIMMVSAFTRLSLYEHAYGFTLLRLLVQSFIVWLSVIFLLLYYKLWKFLPESFLAFWSLMLVIGFFVFWNALNPDAFIAKKNIEQFAKAGLLDTKYLSTLSADAIPEIAKLLQYEGYLNKYGRSLPEAAREILKSKKERYSKQPWQSFNLSRNKAEVLVVD